jgi:hypothetical protein
MLRDLPGVPEPDRLIAHAHEIGIRLALGAQKRDVLGLVMREGAVLVTLGASIGLACAWARMRAMGDMFAWVASVKGADPLLLVGAPLLLAGLALPACYVPARGRRASTQWWRCGRSNVLHLPSALHSVENVARAHHRTIFPVEIRKAHGVYFIRRAPRSAPVPAAERECGVFHQIRIEAQISRHPDGGFH